MRGNPPRGNLQSFTGAGYSVQQGLQVMLAMAVKMLSNYTRHLFDTPLDAAFAAYALPEKS